MLDQDAVDMIIGRLEGRQIVGSGIARDESGFHIWLDDGTVFVCIGTVGVYRPVESRLQ